MGRRTSKNWEAYSGQSRQLIVAIDIGTTFSGAAYSILQPGEVPKIYDVGSFPGQQAGFHKVPSIALYSPDGSILGIGSETATERMKVAASHVGAYEARWWKMALRSIQSKAGEATDMDDFIFIPPGKSAQDIFTDYLRWIMKCTEDFISAKYRGGAQLIEETYRSRTIVLTHPNGWEGAQQAAMRKACVDSAIVDQSKAKNVQFVSEAEASMTFALTSQAMSSWTQDGSQIVIVDAGGGTIDITSYEILSTCPFVSVQETSVPRCLLAGAINIDRGAAELIADRLEGTRWDNTDDLTSIVEDFTRLVKHSFSNQRNPCVLKIGPSIENDERIGIRKGMLVLDWTEVAALFQPSIDQTVSELRSIFSHLKGTSQKKVALVGGFSENAFFRESVASALSSEAIVVKPDNATSKAVANGAVAWAIDSVVSSRISKVWYGVCCAVPYDRRDQQHVERERDIIHSADGKKRLPNGFQLLLAKGEAQSPDKEAIADFSITKTVGEKLQGSFDLIAYRGDEMPPCFIEDDNGFEIICRMEVNLDRVLNGLPIQTSNGKRYRTARFQIHALLSDTELKARWVWDEQAVPQSGEVHTVFLDELDLFTRKAATLYIDPIQPETSNRQAPTSPSIASFDLQEGLEAYRDEARAVSPMPVSAVSQEEEVSNHVPRADSITQEQIERFARTFFAIQTEERRRRQAEEASRQPLTPSDLLRRAQAPIQQENNEIQRNTPYRQVEEGTYGRNEEILHPPLHACHDVKTPTIDTNAVLPADNHGTGLHRHSSKAAERSATLDDSDKSSPPPAYDFFDADIER